MPAMKPLRPPIPHLDNLGLPRETVPVALDRMLHTWQSSFTAGRSPSTVSLAFLDWAALTGDVNPAHVDPAYVDTDMFHHIIIRACGVED